jgi:dolichol-phosphate mannosyltransferase
MQKSTSQAPLISVIIPVLNEEKNIQPFWSRLEAVFAERSESLEAIFVNDGSTDGTGALIEKIAERDPRVRYLEFSRNFGKEAATTAGLQACRGDAAIILDADLQHPPELVEKFLEKWHNGAEIVIGVRGRSGSESVLYKAGASIFYKVMQAISDTEITPRATDYRLMDRSVIGSFRRFTEHNRMTRGLIDWLGFRREYIRFTIPMRVNGSAKYTLRKRLQLAISSITSHSLLPLKLAGHLGVFIVILSGIIGFIMILDRYIFMWGFEFSGPAMLAILNLFLVGVVLICLGLLAQYIAHMFTEVQNRPLYVIRRSLNNPE